MIIERHYDDEVLIALLDSPEGLEIVARDPHLASCQSCAELLASFRGIADVLGEGPVWDLRELSQEPVPETIATLRAFANTMTLEDAHAEAFVADLLAGPRELWMETLIAHPEYRTAGTVRKLIAALDSAYDEMPSDAVEIARLAVEIADTLPVSEATMKLQGTAWRERAYSLHFVGNAQKALPAIRHCLSIYEHVVIDEYDRARADLVEALILRECEDLVGSRRLAANAADAFRTFGDDRRRQLALMTTAMVAYRAKDFRTALEIWLGVEADLPDDEYEMKASLVLNIGACYRNLGDRETAVQHFKNAIALFDFYGIRPSRAKTCWSTALLMLEQANYGAALSMLEDARRDFESLGMFGEVTFVSLDIAETLLQLGRTAEVLSLCRTVLAQAAEAGVVSQQPQMAALAYISEVTSIGQLTPAVIHTVRDQLKRAGVSSAQLFAYLPN